MKKNLILSFILLSLGSCTLDNDVDDFQLEILPIESVDIPESFTMGQTYPITVSYYVPTTCHLFKEFYYDRKNNVRTVAVIDYKYLNKNCQELENRLVEATFNFQVTSNGSYVFKFWQGEDENGENQYLTIEVPVIE